MCIGDTIHGLLLHHAMIIIYPCHMFRWDYSLIYFYTMLLSSLTFTMCISKAIHDFLLHQAMIITYLYHV